jgi:hypothetical protein
MKYSLFSKFVNDDLLNNNIYEGVINVPKRKQKLYRKSVPVIRLKNIHEYPVIFPFNKR